jgi:hypothetical protein
MVGPFDRLAEIDERIQRQQFLRKPPVQRTQPRGLSPISISDPAERVMPTETPFSAVQAAEMTSAGLGLMPQALIAKTALDVGTSIAKNVSKRRALRREARRLKREVRQGDPMVEEQRQRGLRRSASQARTTRQQVLSDDPATQALLTQKIEQGVGEREADIEGRAGAQQSAFRAGRRGALDDVRLQQEGMNAELLGDLSEDIGGGVLGVAAAVEGERQQEREQRARFEKQQQEILTTERQFEVEQDKLALGRERLTATQEQAEESRLLRSALQESRQKFTREEREAGEEFKTAEREETEAFKTAEREATQTFETAEAKKERDARLKREQTRIENTGDPRAVSAFRTETLNLESRLFSERRGRKIRTALWDDKVQLGEILFDAGERLSAASPKLYPTATDGAMALAKSYGIDIGETE